MNEISVYLEFWEYLLGFGMKTIEIIESENAWDYRFFSTEFSIIDTFNHTVQAIYEDAGTWFLKDSKKYVSSTDPKSDLNQAINRMKIAIQDFDNEKLEREFTYQWGEKTLLKEHLNKTFSMQ